MTKLLKIFVATLSIVCAIILFGVITDSDSEPTSRVFCAYGQMFIEFEEGRHQWGTLLLDPDGRPIACKNGQSVNNYQNSILGKII